MGRFQCSCHASVLLEAPAKPSEQLRQRALLTVDLTKAVADEAISGGVSIIVSYRTWACLPVALAGCTK